MPEANGPVPEPESVWDYPEPPRWEDTFRHIQVIFNGVVIADTRQGVRLLLRGHAPYYYIPPDDVLMECLSQAGETRSDPDTGEARLYNISVGDKNAEKAAWCYAKPAGPYERIKKYIAFFPAMMDACTVDGVIVTAQPGGVYGGWVSPEVVGPFVGEEGEEVT